MIRDPAPAPLSGAFRAVWRWHFYAGLLVLPFLMLHVTIIIVVWKLIINKIFIFIEDIFKYFFSCNSFWIGQIQIRARMQDLSRIRIGIRIT